MHRLDEGWGIFFPCQFFSWGIKGEDGQSQDGKSSFCHCPFPGVKFRVQSPLKFLFSFKLIKSKFRFWIAFLSWTSPGSNSGLISCVCVLKAWQSWRHFYLSEAKAQSLSIEVLKTSMSFLRLNNGSSEGGRGGEIDIFIRIKLHSAHPGCDSLPLMKHAQRLHPKSDFIPEKGKVIALFLLHTEMSFGHFKSTGDSAEAENSFWSAEDRGKPECKMLRYWWQTRGIL